MREIRTSRFTQLARDFERHGVRFAERDQGPAQGVTQPPALRVVA